MYIGSYVNKIGNYLLTHIPGAYDIKKKANMCDVYMTVYYQTSQMGSKPGQGKQYSDLYEMNLDINITTYQNKIRVNIIVDDENEQTLDYSLYSEAAVADLSKLKVKILNKINKVLTRTFEGYEFIF